MLFICSTCVWECPESVRKCWCSIRVGHGYIKPWRVSVLLGTVASSPSEKGGGEEIASDHLPLARTSTRMISSSIYSWCALRWQRGCFFDQFPDLREIRCGEGFSWEKFADGCCQEAAVIAAGTFAVFFVFFFSLVDLLNQKLFFQLKNLHSFSHCPSRLRFSWGLGLSHHLCGQSRGAFSTAFFENLQVGILCLDCSCWEIWGCIEDLSGLEEGRDMRDRKSVV